jgi:tRNA (cmo5U34)-methyltransferase
VAHSSDFNSQKDRLFSSPISKQFEFDESVALVFDDMLNRSVPFYQESLDLTTFYISELVGSGGTVLDIGCSTANTLIALDKKNDKRFQLVGIDSSHAMIEKAQSKAQAFGVDIRLIESDFLDADFPKSDAVIANYTLQFIRPRKREELVRKIFDALAPDGIFIFSEKVVTDDAKLNKLMVEKYYAYKKTKGYSEFEIAQKREALENVLVPYSEAENKEMILSNGFSYFETIFRWNNFATFIAKK